MKQQQQQQRNDWWGRSDCDLINTSDISGTLARRPGCWGHPAFGSDVDFNAAGGAPSNERHSCVALLAPECLTYKCCSNQNLLSRWNRTALRIGALGCGGARGRGLCTLVFKWPHNPLIGCDLPLCTTLASWFWRQTATCNGWKCHYHFAVASHSFTLTIKMGEQRNFC